MISENSDLSAEAKQIEELPEIKLLLKLFKRDKLMKGEFKESKNIEENWCQHTFEQLEGESTEDSRIVVIKLSESQKQKLQDRESQTNQKLTSEEIQILSREYDNNSDQRPFWQKMFFKSQVKVN